MLAETHEEWLGRKYLDMDELNEWNKARQQARAGVVAVK